MTMKAVIAAVVAAAAVVCLYMQPRWQFHQPAAVAYWQDTALNTPAWNYLTNNTACNVTDPRHATLIVTQSLDPDTEVAVIAARYPTVQHLYGAMRGINAVGNKANMALLLRQHLPTSVAHHLTPPTYILTEMDDLQRLDAVEPGQGLFYFKSYVHAQHMVLITGDPAAVLREQGTPYIVSQQILGQPLTVHTTKVTLRAYLLLIARHGSLTVHVAKDGPVYYADEPYNDTSSDEEVVVANKYPLAPGFPPFISGLMDILGEPAWEVLWENILRALGTTMHALQGFLERQNADLLSSPKDASSSSRGASRSIILGVDLLPLQNLTIKLLEINAAPHLGILYDSKEPASKQASVKFAADLLCGGLHLAGALACPAAKHLWMPLTTGLLLKDAPAAAGDLGSSNSSSSTGGDGGSRAREGSDSSSSSSHSHAGDGDTTTATSSSSSQEGRADGQKQQQQQQAGGGLQSLGKIQAADGDGIPAIEDI